MTGAGGSLSPHTNWKGAAGLTVIELEVTVVSAGLLLARSWELTGGVDCEIGEHGHAVETLIGPPP